MMMSRTFFLPALALALVTGLVGCGGGGAQAPVTLAPPGGSIPAASSSNSLTTYTVYTGALGADSVVAVEPLGQTVSPALAGAKIAPGAIVVYPDGTLQTADVLGNFDASKSLWAAANIDALVANPYLEPTVSVTLPGIDGIVPAEVAVAAYAPGGTIVTASAAVHVLSATRAEAGASASSDLASVVVLPQAASIFDNQRANFHALGQDSNGSTLALNGAALKWSLAAAAGCPAPAGRIAVTANDASKAIYTPPAAGNSPANCPDLVVATLASGSVVHSGSGSVSYFDQRQAVKLAGTLKNTAGQPLASALIDLYGGGPEAKRGSSFVQSSANGTFSRMVSPSRTLYPIAAPKDAANPAKRTFYAVIPATISPAAAGASLGAQIWSVTSSPFNRGTANAPQPPYAKMVRDAHFLGALARESFPFGAPNADGKFAPGGIEAILASPQPNASGTVSSGAFSGYRFAWDAAGKVATVTQPASQGARRRWTFTIGAVQVNGQACPAGAKCFSYARSYNASGFGAGAATSGTLLEIDGAWSQLVASGSFNVTLVRNEYTAARQTAGQPLAQHVVTTAQTLGSQALTLSDQWKNADGRPLGTMTASRQPASPPALYAYSASARRLYYKADGGTVAVDYSLSAGVQNADQSGSYRLTVTASPVKSDVGASVSWAAATPAQVAATGKSATGFVDSPALTGLTSGHAASFSVNLSSAVSLTKDASLGGGTIVFQL